MIITNVDESFNDIFFGKTQKQFVQHVFQRTVLLAESLINFKNRKFCYGRF